MKDGRGKWENTVISGYADYDDNMPHEEYVAWQRAVLTEMMRVIKDDGAFFTITNGVSKQVSADSDIVEGFPVSKSYLETQSGINFNPGYFLPTYEVIYLIANKDFKLEDGVNKWRYLGSGQDRQTRTQHHFP